MNRLLPARGIASGGVITAAVLVSWGMATGEPASAQSFFATLVTDPTVGVDRGSASQIRKLDIPTGFLTFDTYGAEDIGRGILGLGAAFPDLVIPGDQLDAVGVLGGPSADGGPELVAGGVAYRFPVLDGAATAFVNADHGEYTLGSEASLPLDARGERTNAAFGLRRRFDLGDMAELTATVELSARSETASAFGTTVVDEDLRLLRGSLLYERGVPLVAQQRLAVSVTKGIGGLGASGADNPRASAPGSSPEFLRASVAAEASFPVSRTVIVNAGIIGQWTDDSLPVSQRCGYGTNGYARGFDQSYVNGDRCLGGRVELAYNIEMPDMDGGPMVFTQGYLGLDGGWVEDMPNLLIPGTRDEWSSVSLGVRTLRGNFIGEASVTRILDKPAGIVEQDDTRFWLRGAIRF